MTAGVRMPSSAASVASMRSTRSSMSTRSRLVLKTGDKEFRARLLNKLGIFGSVPADARESVRLEGIPSDPATTRRTNMLRGMGYGGIQSTTLPRQALVDADEANLRPKLADAVLFEEPLKWKESPPRIHSLFGARGSPRNSRPKKTSPSAVLGDAASASKKSTKKGICFSDSVSVVQIPMRSEYSSRIKSRIWSDRYEIHENATRNAIEFASEGWDWRKVTEDEGMFVCTVSGELVHPVHCSQFYEKQHQGQASSSCSQGH